MRRRGRSTRHPLAAVGAWLPGAAGHRPPGVLDDRVDDDAGLPAGLRRGDLTRSLADQRREGGRVEPVERGIGEPQQRVVLPDPLVLPAAPHELESGRAIARDEQHRQVPALPAALEEGTRADAEQGRRVVLAVLARLRDGAARRLLVRLLVLLPQGEEELALAAEVVVQAADARACPLDHVRDAGVGEPLLSEHVAGGVEQGPLGLLGTPPLPGGWPAHLVGHVYSRSSTVLANVRLDSFSRP